MRLELDVGATGALEAGLVQVTLLALDEQRITDPRGSRVPVVVAELSVAVGPRTDHHRLGLAIGARPLPVVAQVPLSLWLVHALELELVATREGHASFAVRRVATEPAEIEGDFEELDPGAGDFVAWWGVMAAADLEVNGPGARLERGADPRTLVPDLERIPGLACTLDPTSTGALEVDFHRGRAGFYVRVRGGCEVWEEFLQGPFPPVTR